MEFTTPMLYIVDKYLSNFHGVLRVQYRCLCTHFNLIDNRHLGIPEYPKVFWNILQPNNDITHIQTIKCAHAVVVST